MKDFSLIYNCKKIIRSKTCCQNPKNPKVHWSDFHKMCFNCIGSFLHEKKPHVIQYQSYKKSSNEVFINDLRNRFFSIQFWKMKKKNVDVTLLAPLEKRYVTENQAPFINRTITKEITKRSGARNNFSKWNSKTK